MEDHNQHHWHPSGAKKALLILLSVFVLFLIVSEGYDIKKKMESSKTIAFSGEGKVVAIPDISLVSFSVVSSADTAAKAMEDNSQKMNSIITFVKESGVEEKDVKTTSYNLYPRYDWLEGKRVFRGYELTSTLSIKIRDLDKISQLIDGAVKKGANQVGDIQFTIDDQEKLKDEARNKAIENAKERAQNIAKASGLKIGRVVNFSESSRGYYPVYDTAMKEMSGIGSAAPQVEAGSQEITVDVVLTFELK